MKSKPVRVLLLSRYDRLGASSRVRAYQYIPFLSENGVEVTPAPLLDSQYLQRRYSGQSRDVAAIAATYLRRLFELMRAGRRFDLLWVEKEIFPWLPGLLEQVLTSRIPYVVDYDDALFHQYDLHPNPVTRWLLGRKIDEVMRRAVVVMTGNEYLASHARTAGARKVEIVPTVIDLDRYDPSPLAHQGLVIGWIGSPATAAYLQLVRKPALHAHRTHGARVVTVGSGNVELGDVPVEVHPWSEASEVDEIRRFDVGIMPLPDEPWERGKCGYKLVQYMSAGKPVIGSPVGVNRDLIQPGVNGLFATTDEEWTDALDRVLRSPAEAARMGQRGRELVERRYCTKVTGPHLLRILREAAARKGC